MSMVLTPARRLIVAADFKPLPDKGRASVEDQFLALAEKLKGTGVVLKGNSALRACGYGLIDRVHAYGLEFMADLKLFDIDSTLKADGVLLREAKPEILTVVCGAGATSLQALKAELPDTEVLGITVLTHLTQADTYEMHGCALTEGVRRFAKVAAPTTIDGLVCSPTQATMLRTEFGERFSLVTPAVRPLWAVVKGDTQNPENVMTPTKAIKAGATRIVVGRPVLEASDPYDAVMMIIEELEFALA